MEYFDPVSLIAGFHRIEIGSAGSAEISAALERVRRLHAWFDAAEVALAGRWRELNPLADRDVSGVAQRSARHGARVAERATTVAAVPGLGALFDAGR